MNVIASVFADLADLHAYQRAKGLGMTDLQAFKFGDNGIGCWGDRTAQEKTPMCALPPDYMVEKFGTVAKAKHKEVLVQYNGRKVICILADRMPWLKNCRTAARIDLNPAAVAALGFPPGGMKYVNWSWV